MLTGGIYGSDFPKFELKQRFRNLRAPLYQLPGTFTFTNGSALVATSESMINTLKAGDVLAPTKTGRRYYVSSVGSTSQVTLDANFEEDTVSNVKGYTRFNVMWMPLTRSTRIWGERFGRAGGPVEVILSDGKFDDRTEGFRLFVEFTWQALDRTMVDRIISMFNHHVKGGEIEVSPHNDVPIKWDMKIASPFNPELTGDKLIGTDYTLLLKSVNIIKELPLSRSTTGSWKPKLF